MIRTTITTLTLSAIAMITLATASPVLAAPSDEPVVTAETTIESPESTCTIETDIGTLPCPVLDWSLGGLFDTGTASDEPSLIGGISSDAPIDVVDDGSEPVLGTPIEEAPAAEDTGTVEVIGREGLRDALRDAGIDLVDPDTDSETTPVETVTVATDVGDAPTTTIVTETVERTPAPTLTASSTVSSTTQPDTFIDEARIRSGRPADTVADSADSIIDLAMDRAEDHSTNLVTIVLVGLLGTVGAMVLLAGAFALGRKNS